MWHASVRAPLGPTSLDRAARDALDGVGDPVAGEWAEHGRSGVYHLRRRLTAAEAERVGGVVDVRATPEAAQRLRQIPKRILALAPLEVLYDELGPPR